MKITVELDESEIRTLVDGKGYGTAQYGPVTTVDPRVVLRIARDMSRASTTERLTHVITGGFKAVVLDVREDPDPHKWAIVLTGVLTSLKE